MNMKLMCISAIAALFLLASCASPAASPAVSLETEQGTKNGQETESEKEEKTEEPPRIGISIYNYEDTFMKLYRHELRAELEDTYSAYVMISDAGGDQDKQQRQVKNYIEQGYDGLIVNLVRPDKAGEITDMCDEAGIPVVFINREPAETEQQRWKKEKIRASYVGTESAQAGNYQGELILDLPDRGDRNRDGTVTYAMIKGDGKTTDSYYRACFPPKVLQEAGLKTSGLFVWPGNWDEDQGYEAATVALGIYGKKLEVIFCGNDAMALGTVRAVEEHGLTPGKDIYIVGVDALDQAVSMVKSGKLTGTLLNDHSTQAKKTAEVVISLAEGGKAENRYVVDYLKITGISDYPISFNTK